MTLQIDLVNKIDTQMIWVKFQQEGIHCFPEAKTDPAFATGDWRDVSFLGDPHRHIFHFRVWIEVFHNDREIEFIQFKRWCERQFAATDDNPVLDINYKSVEMLADDLYVEIATTYGTNREVWIEVSEDNENGCFKKYGKD